MDQMRSIARSWVGFWVSVVSENDFVRLAAPMLASIVAIAVVASFVRWLAVSREIGSEFRLHDRVDRWHRRFESAEDPAVEQVPEAVLVRWARLEFRRADRWSRVGRATEALGGLAFWPLGWPRPLAALRPLTVLISAAVVYVGWPNADEASSAAAFVATNAERLLSGLSAVPVAAIGLLIAVVTLVPRTPLVDHIRARDDAARTANAQLAQLSGCMHALYYGAADWRGRLLLDRSGYVRTMVEQATSGHYTWSAGGVRPAPTGRRASSRVLAPTGTTARFTEAFDRVCEQRRDLQATGVDLVAWRLSGRGVTYLRLAGVHWYGQPSDRDVGRVYHPPSEVKEFLERCSPLVSEADEVSEGKLCELDRSARNAARVMDLFIADIALGECGLYATVNYLNGRMVGRWWIRAFSATQR